MFTAVAGSIVEHLLTGGFLSGIGPHLVPNASIAPSPPGPTAPPSALTLPQLPPTLQEVLSTAFKAPNRLQSDGQPADLTIQGGTLFANTLQHGAYEARVLQGIWAAAPYLHNGSVPTLAELLKPSAQRMSQFSLGPKYDVNNVGLAAAQVASSPIRIVNDCNDLNTGNSRCGHDFGTELSDQEKKALLEYLKNL
jgi:hypothetical protein